MAKKILLSSKKKWFLSSVEKRILKLIGQQFDFAVQEKTPDVVLVIHGDLLAYTQFTEPACIIHDATFAALTDYYPSFTNLSNRSIRAGNIMYYRALKRAKAAIFSSDWASASAIRDYQATTEKVRTIPFGANLIEVPNFKEVKTFIEGRSRDSICQFLFLGVDWERKGGPDAVQFVCTLNQMGIKSRLVIIGCTPDIPFEYQKFVECHGFLNKDIPFEAERIENSLKESHALLVPSLAECYGCVYCEANAYGLPALARDSGGVSEIIKDGLNGLLLGRYESLENFAERWKLIWEDEVIYQRMSSNSRKEYEERLNYTVFVKKLEDILLTITETRKN